VATSVDTNVIGYLLLDADGDRADAAEAALRGALGAGRIVVCGPVFAELLATEAWDAPTLLSALATMRFDVHLPLDAGVWPVAAQAYAGYLRSRRPADYVCPRCLVRGQELSRPKHILSDFLIGADADHHGHALLTDDAGLYEAFFPRVPLRRL